MTQCQCSAKLRIDTFSLMSFYTFLGILAVLENCAFYFMMIDDSKMNILKETADLNFVALCDFAV